MSSFYEKLQALFLSPDQIVAILAAVDEEIIGDYEAAPPVGELTIEAWMEQDDHIATKNALRKEHRERLWHARRIGIQQRGMGGKQVESVVDTVLVNMSETEKQQLRQRLEKPDWE